jgi:hypothetical protein
VKRASYAVPHYVVFSSPPATCSPLGPNILLSTLLWNTLNVWSSLNVRDPIRYVKWYLWCCKLSKTSSERCQFHASVTVVTKLRVKYQHKMSYVNVNFSQDSSVSIVTMLWAGRPGIDSRQELENFLFTTAYRPALWPTQPPIQRVAGGLSTKKKNSRGVRLTTHLHLAPRLITRGDIPPLPHTSSWRGAQSSPGTTLSLPRIYLIEVIKIFSN